MTGQILCRLADLAATGAKEIILDKAGARLPVFVVKYGADVLGYVNSCPHARLPLNWREDIFFDLSRTYLFCANHGATFEVKTGRCLRGPCKGLALTRYPVRLVGDTILSAEI